MKRFLSLLSGLCLLSTPCYANVGLPWFSLCNPMFSPIGLFYVTFFFVCLIETKILGKFLTNELSDKDITLSFKSKEQKQYPLDKFAKRFVYLLFGAIFIVGFLSLLYQRAYLLAILLLVSGYLFKKFVEMILKVEIVLSAPVVWTNFFSSFVGLGIGGIWGSEDYILLQEAYSTSRTELDIELLKHMAVFFVLSWLTEFLFLAVRIFRRGKEKKYLRLCWLTSVAITSWQFGE